MDASERQQRAAEAERYMFEGGGVVYLESKARRRASAVCARKSVTSMSVGRPARLSASLGPPSMSIAVACV
jgi:hypothetical protein